MQSQPDLFESILKVLNEKPVPKQAAFDLLESHGFSVNGEALQQFFNITNILKIKNILKEKFNIDASHTIMKTDASLIINGQKIRSLNDFRKHIYKYSFSHCTLDSCGDYILVNFHFTKQIWQLKIEENSSKREFVEQLRAFADSIEIFKE